MGLQLVYGRSGTGKSEYCFQNAKEFIETDKIYFITPEQFSFTAEKKLLDTLGTQSVINAEVLSFGRIATRVFSELGGSTKTHLTKCGTTMLLYDILDSKKKELKFLSQAEKNTDVAINIVTELKKHNINEQALLTTIENTEDIYLKTKLEDINTIYTTFQERIKNNFIDERDILTKLSEQIENSKIFKNAIIYIDEFVGFTAQEYEIIKGLLNIAKKVVVTVTADVELNTDITNLDKTDIFYETKKTAQKLIQCARDIEAKIETPIILKETPRFKTKELQYIEENIYNTTKTSFTENVENVKLFLATNPYSEIEYVAKRIIELVRQEQYQFNDIAIITKNINTYSSITKAIFEKYNIPVFIDENKDLNQNKIAKYILSIFDIFSKNWSYESVFNYLKTPFSGVDIDTVYKLENYCIKWGIKNKKWLKEWNYDDDQTQSLEKIRQYIVGNLTDLQEKMKDAKDFTSMTTALYNFLVETKIEDKINNKIAELEEPGLIEAANEYSASAKVILNVLDEIVLLFEKKKTTFEKYQEILKIGLDNIDVGKIPATLDQVIVGDIERSKSHKVKAVFIIGLNDGVFPSNNKEEGFLNDQDRETLKHQGIELASGTLEQLYEEQLNIYKAFTIAENKLFLSYCSSDKEGKSLRQSMLVTKIKKLFPKIVIESDVISKKSEITITQTTFEELLSNIRLWQDGKKIEAIWFDVLNWYKHSKDWKPRLDTALKALEYTNLPEKISEKNQKELYGNTLKTSITRLEQYKKCPFSFHLRYGLNLQEQQQLQMRPIDTGSFMHDVIDTFFDRIKQKNVKVLSKEEINEIVNSIIDEMLQMPKNYIFTSTAKFRVLTRRLKKVIFQSIYYIVEQLKQSDFTIFGNELEFKQGKQYPPISLSLENGQKVEITGKIDRVDLAIAGDKKFIRIIDYKSSIKNIDLNEVVNGLQIQLLTYLDSITEIEDVVPAGVLYFSLIETIVKNNKNLTDEEIEQHIRKQFKMNGLILADVKIVKMMDNKLQTGYSDIVPAYIKSDGTLSQTQGNVITHEDFKNLQKQVKKVIKQISTEILKGNIDIKPYKNKKSACEYCAYKSICGFDTALKGNNYFTIPERKKEEILASLEGI